LGANCKFKREEEEEEEEKEEATNQPREAITQVLRKAPHNNDTCCAGTYKPPFSW
jgi:hypothetical protein